MSAGKSGSKIAKKAAPSPIQGSIAENGEAGKRRQALIRRASSSGSGKYPSRGFPWILMIVPFGSRLDGYPPMADNEGKWS